MNIVVLGGYGNFGKRIVENLASIEGITVFIAGRCGNKAKTCADNLASISLARLVPLVIDIFAYEFETKLTQLSPYLVIHTCGPYQGQNYRVPQACINVGAHYIDLADDRKFVCNIKQLDETAKEKKVLVVSGASSVPGLSSSVIEHFQSQFDSIDTIDLAIAPGNQAERGFATVKAILSYTGHPFTVFKNGQWKNIFGWMDAKVIDFGGIVGKRNLANVDVPDLELFPERYQVNQRVSFQAGLELPFLHLTMVSMAFLTKIGVVKNWAPLTKWIVKMSNLFLTLGTNKGAMQVSISGQNAKSEKIKKVKWTLYAPEGHGPYIPTLSTIILARRLIEKQTDMVGATPCVGLFNLENFKEYFESLGIFYEERVEDN